MLRLVSHAVVLMGMTVSLEAASITFSFLNDIWTNPNGTQAGFVSQTAAGANNSSTGFITKSGLTLTFTGSFVGTAVSSSIAGSGGQGPSFTNATSINPLGFIFGSANNSNPLSFTTDSFSGLVSNYQRWDFSFSAPVVLTDFWLQDIDSDGLSGGFRDLISAESFQTVTPGAPGTGTIANYTLHSPTRLLIGEVTIGGRTLASVGAPLGLGNLNNDPRDSARIGFGSTAVSSFSVYAFSDRNTNHRMSLDSSSFQVNFDDPNAVPEPGTALLGSLGLMAGWLLRRR